MELLEDLPDCISYIVIGYVNAEIKMAGLMAIAELRGFMFQFLGEKTSLDFDSCLSNSLFKYNWRLMTTRLPKECILSSFGMSEKIELPNYSYYYESHIREIMDRGSKLEDKKCAKCGAVLTDMYFDVELYCEDCGKKKEVYTERNYNGKNIYIPNFLNKIKNENLFCRFPEPIGPKVGHWFSDFVLMGENYILELTDFDYNSIARMSKYTINSAEFRIFNIALMYRQRHPGTERIMKKIFSISTS